MTDAEWTELRASVPRAERTEDWQRLRAMYLRHGWGEPRADLLADVDAGRAPRFLAMLALGGGRAW